MLSCHRVIRFLSKVQGDYPGFFEQDRRISLFLQAGSHSRVCQKARTAIDSRMRSKVTWAGCCPLRNLHRTLAPKGRHLTCHPEMDQLCQCIFDVLSCFVNFLKFVLNTFDMQNLAFPLAMLCNNFCNAVECLDCRRIPFWRPETGGPWWQLECS